MIKMISSGLSIDAHLQTPAVCPRCGKPHDTATNNNTAHECWCACTGLEMGVIDTTSTVSYGRCPHCGLPYESSVQECFCRDWQPSPKPEPLGWRCPGCKRVFAPNTKECNYCNG